MASKKKNLRLNSVSRGAEAVIYIVLGLFSRSEEHTSELQSQR